MPLSSNDALLDQLPQHPKLAEPDYANFIKLLKKLPKIRPAVASINTKDTVVVCRREILAEAISYYRSKYDTLPVFYTFSPDNSLDHSCSDAVVKDIETLSPNNKVHIFTSLTARRPGHLGLTHLVRQVATKGIFTPSIELESIDRFCNANQPTSLSISELTIMKECYSALEDQESKSAFLGTCKARLLGNPSFIPLALYPQYYHPEVQIEEGDVVCEGGICDGKTSAKFARTVGERGKVYAFEPVPTCYENSLKRTWKYSNIHLECKALWKTNDLLPLTITNPTLGYSSVVNQGTPVASQCQATSIDNFFKSSPPPTLIKLDVEGAEIAVLEGALKTIRNYRPKLVISIYHTNNGNDLLNVPKFLLDLNLNYALYVGHHSVWFNETILYAIPKDREHHTKPAASCRENK